MTTVEELFRKRSMDEMMTCVMDKNVKCGIFKNWEDFLKWDGEKYCRTFCNKERERFSRRRKIKARESFKNKRAWERKVYGRKVA